MAAKLPAAGVLERIRLGQIQRAELSVCDHAASFLQSGFWGGFKSCFGWEPLAFTVDNQFYGDSSGSAPLLVLRRSLSPGFAVAYIPWGPELPPDFPADDKLRGGALEELALALKALLPADTAFIRFDPPWYSEGPGTPPPQIPPPFVRSGADIQPPDTVLLDLTPSIEDLMAQMKPKWRYNARLALKKGVTLRRAAAEEIGVFYELLKETARRDGIAIHGPEYYKTLLANNTPNCIAAGIDTRLYLAEHEGDTLAGIVTLFRRKEAVYLYGASSNKKRNFMSPYALQVKAMEDAKAAGCEAYDLFGIPPNNNPAHAMAGLYRFKTGFGGKIIHRPGSWDFPCRPLLYRLFRCAETFRKTLRTARKKNRP